MHEHIPAAIVRFDEAVTPLAIEELDRTTLRHREAPFPQCCPAAGPHGTAARPDIRSTGKASAPRRSHFRRPPEGGGTSEPSASRHQPEGAGKGRSAAPFTFRL